MQSASAIAEETLSALDAARQIVPFSRRGADFTLDEAYRAARHLRLLRSARGERPVGRKIGFTNRSIWAQYGVDRPIYGDMYDTTLHEISRSGETVGLTRFCEPQIEPEIVFGLAASPDTAMDDRALLGCIEWVAHGFEIVQSIFPGWQFSAADTVAAGGLHGALVLGERVLLSTLDDPPNTLSRFEIALSRDGTRIDVGGGANVLGSPLLALRHLCEQLACEDCGETLRPGEIVTTGTLTRAFPVVPGQRWATALNGIGLRGLTVAFG